MYIPDAFVVSDAAETDDLLRRIPFGSLVTGGPDGVAATHLPFLHDLQSGVLTAHMARVNPHRGVAGDGEALVIFQGPYAYVSPNWYPSKAQGGRVVPTWNYEAVHVYGRISWRGEPDWLIDHLGALSARFEADQAAPWSIEDAPADYVRRLVDGIIGLEIKINRIEAKRKLSQNKSEADRLGVICGLAASSLGQDREIAEQMKALVP
jgi:transcriptional regulator